MNRPSRDQRVPEGTSCSEHPAQPAQFHCVRCGNNVCVMCWQPAFGRCQRCLLQSPADAAPPLPWERSGNLIVRYFATLASALRPIATAPAFASGTVRPAALFALLTALPFALLAGILPHTRTLLFSHFEVKVLESPSSLELTFDVLRAMAVEGGLTALRFSCLFFPFVSLVRAYAAPERHAAATRMMLYRAWLVPAMALVYYYAGVWPLPADLASLEPAPASIVMTGFAMLLLVVLLMMAMSAAARIACGLGPWLSMVVVMVPVTLLHFVNALLSAAADLLLPPMPPLQ